MRASAIAIALFSAVTLSISGCGTTEDHGGGGVQDMSVVVNMTADLSQGLKCSATDTLGDGQACGAGSSCPSGQLAVEIGNACKCFTSCDPLNEAKTCPCDRVCDPLKALGDGGISGGACLPANGGGERCGTDASGKPFGTGLCAQGLVCVATDQTGVFHYCDYLCFGSSEDCPLQTECDPLMNAMGQTFANYCNVLHGTGAKGLDMPCTVGTDTCQAGLLCDGTACKSQCDGPNGTCTAGTTCSPVTDGMRTVGYVCK